jgi:SPP1 family predicted phage head-tail adaptor
MRFGRMDRRVTIQRATLATNEYGERAETWGTLATMWAEISYKYGSGSESIQSDQILAKQPVSFVIRYSTTTSGILPSDRVSYDGKIYQIEAVQEIGRSEGLRIVTTLRGE